MTKNDESLLNVGMRRVGNRERQRIAEHGGGFGKTHSMLGPIRRGLVIIPFKIQHDSIAHPFNPSPSVSWQYLMLRSISPF